jgi:hypothetical protein
MMRTRGRTLGGLGALGLAALMGAGPLLGGCGERKPKEENIRDVVEAQQRARRVKAQADMQAIRSEVQAYAAEHGGFPERLEALAFVRDQHIDASLYEYDPATGEVRLRD